ncbi:MAG: RDD family protein [Acidiferrobacteraceae bacterium]
MESGVRYAGFWRRFAASLLDTVVLMLPLSLIVPARGTQALLRTLMRQLTATLAGARPTPLPWRRLFDVAGPQTIVVTVVIIIFWVTLLGTPGKLLLGCHVVDATSGQALSVRQAVVRNLAYILSLIPFGLGFLWIAWDPRKQGLHDKLAHSVVIRVPRRWRK